MEANGSGGERRTPLHVAALEGKRDLELLLAEGAGLDVVDKEGRGLLQAAARGGDVEVVEAVSRRGKDGNEVDEKG